MSFYSSLLFSAVSPPDCDLCEGTAGSVFIHHSPQCLAQSLAHSELCCVIQGTRLAFQLGKLRVLAEGPLKQVWFGLMVEGKAVDELDTQTCFPATSVIPGLGEEA